MSVKWRTYNPMFGVQYHSLFFFFFFKFFFFKIFLGFLKNLLKVLQERNRKLKHNI